MLRSALLLCTTLLLAVTPPAPPSAIAGLNWLTGRTWTSRPAGGLGKVQRIDTHYAWSSTGNFVQFDTQFVGADGSIDRRYAGMFFVDPKEGPSVWYMHQDNTVTTGRIDVRPDGMTMRIADADGTYRVEVNRTSPTRYTWTLFSQSGGNWAKTLSLEFQSSP